MGTRKEPQLPVGLERIGQVAAPK